MSYLVNDPRDFRREFLVGLVAANSSLVKAVPGGAGVTSVTAPAQNEVAVVIGGGSGHFPAFAGLVGPGLCDGAVVGEIFTSPSARAVHDLIVATDSGRGVLLSFGNYAGDVMHFGLAAQRARREGRDVRIVLVTDDVASAPADRVDARRGVAGGFYVFRAASAAARTGMSLDDVEAVARLANDRVFTFGVAYGGCTFPGADGPLFVIPESKVALGLGIHGEPGIELRERPPAMALGALMLERLLKERPKGANRARVLVNGLGAVKYEELYVLTSSLLQQLQEVGVEVVDVVVGEFVTSLDMPGCSVTLCWTTPELEALFESAAEAPGLVCRGGVAVTAPDVRRLASDLKPAQVVDQPDVVRIDSAQCAATAFGLARDAIQDAVDELGKIDAIAGDGDHGFGMSRGFAAAAAAAECAGPGLPEVLDAAGLAFADQGGGASGALWGAGLCALGHAIGQGRSPGDAAKAALAAVIDLGGAQVGDKTVVDAAGPFVARLQSALEEGLPLKSAWLEAVKVAELNTEATRGMVSRRGRAAVHSQHGLGTPDPGCVSFVIAVKAAAQALSDSESEGAPA